MFCKVGYLDLFHFTLQYEKKETLKSIILKYLVIHQIIKVQQ